MAYIKIAICDDEKIICGELETILINILQANNIKYDIDVYYTGEELLSSFGTSYTGYDLIFLDIELPNQNGISIGNYIRDKLKDQKTEVSYISSKTSYAMDLFKLRPIDFLEKPITTQKVSHVINTFLTVTEQNDKKFHYRKNKKTFSVPLSEIIYFENDARKVRLHTPTEIIEFYDSFDSILKQLNTDQFVLVHKSFIVNHKHILSFGTKNLKMSDNSYVPISQSKRKHLVKLFAELQINEFL